MSYVQNFTKQAALLLALLAGIFIVGIFYSNTANAAPVFEEPVNYEIAKFDDLGIEDWGGQVLDSVVADFNGDGFLDIAATYIDGNTPSADYNTPAGIEGVAILLNDGDGTYTISSYVPYEENLVSITTADFDGDGDADLATVNNATDEITILINDGDGNFVILEDVETGLVPEKISQADLDSDGDIDLVVSANDVTRSFSNTGNPGVSIFINDGYANFSLSSTISDQTLNEDFSPTYVDYGDFTVTDFDSDGDIDVLLVGGKNLEATYLIAENQGNGTFSTSSLSMPEEYSGPESTLNKVFSADIDSDGDTDLLVEESVNGWLIMFNDGLGAFSTIQPVGFGYFDKMVLNDFDQDDDLDLLAANNGTNTFTLLTNNGLGNFTEEVITTTSTGGFTSLHAEDLNNDEKWDLVVTSVDHQLGVAVFLQVDDGQETPAEQAAVLVADVLDLDIPNNVENSYLANLFKVEAFIEGGQNTAAINQLSAFINKVNQDYNQGKLTLEEQGNLVSAAQQLIDALSN